MDRLRAIRAGAVPNVAEAIIGLCMRNEEYDIDAYAEPFAFASKVLSAVPWDEIHPELRKVELLSYLIDLCPWNEASDHPKEVEVILTSSLAALCSKDSLHPDARVFREQCISTISQESLFRSIIDESGASQLFDAALDGIDAYICPVTENIVPHLPTAVLFGLSITKGTVGYGEEERFYEHNELETPLFGLLKEFSDYETFEEYDDSMSALAAFFRVFVERSAEVDFFGQAKVVSYSKVITTPNFTQYVLHQVFFRLLHATALSEIGRDVAETLAEAVFRGPLGNAIFEIAEQPSSHYGRWRTGDGFNGFEVRWHRLTLREIFEKSTSPDLVRFLARPTTAKRAKM